MVARISIMPGGNQVASLHVQPRHGHEIRIHRERLRASLAVPNARLNPALWAPARAVEAVRRRDPAAERSWQDRLQNRLNGCRAIVERMAKEGTLKPGLNPTLAADLLWTLTSLRTWEDLVLERGWTATEYEKRLTDLVLDARRTLK